eukprot:scaffold93081_cov78-Phaeocystis_antarctica.AAC.5
MGLAGPLLLWSESGDRLGTPCLLSPSRCENDSRTPTHRAMPSLATAKPEKDTPPLPALGGGFSRADGQHARGPCDCRVWMSGRTLPGRFRAMRYELERQPPVGGNYSGRQPEPRCECRPLTPACRPDPVVHAVVSHALA